MKNNISRCSVLLIGLALLIASSVIGCGESYTQEDLDAAYETGHAEGYDDGSHAGYKVGYTEGYDTGKAEGYEAGSLEGYKVGYAEGKDAGLAELESAKQEAEKLGYDKGYKDGLAQAQLTEGELSVHFTDVGQGDSILLDLGETEILIDGGGKSPGVVEYISDYVDGALEVIVATHPHADHIGGLIDVLAEFEVNEIWHNGDTSTSQTYSQFMSAVNSEGAQVYEARRGDIIEVGKLNFNVLHPVNLSGTVNNNSIVLSLSYGEVDLLFTGDAEQEAEASMLEEGIVPNVEILKVGHHGSRTASSIQFLQIAKPELAIYMAAEGNSYGHPHPETIAALTQVGAEIYGTDAHGTVTVTSDGHEYTLPPIATFTTTGLSINPAEVSIGESVTISVVVTNTGGITGTYAVTLKINNVAVESKSVTLADGASQNVTFTTAKDVAGTYTVGIDGLSRTFQVNAAPANFTVTNLSISPDDVKPGRTVTISATVSNSGGSSGSYTAILYINASQVETKSITLNAGESQVVSFTVVKESTGYYHVVLGGLTGTFAVTKAVTPPSNDTVYITRTGAKYHRGSCHYLRQSKIAIDRQEAIRRGYTPCSVCRP